MTSSHIAARWVSGTCLALLGLVAGLSSSTAAERYPAQPIKLVVPYPPGAGVDLAARLIVPQLSQELGEQVFVENRAGAGGAVGSQFVANAKPDGYTLLLADAGPLAINPALNKRLGYDPMRSFAPVIYLASLPTVLVVSPSLNVTTLKQFIDLAKQRPGKINYASAGLGSSTHLAMELLKMQAQINIVHIPYGGTAPALAAVLSGEPSLMFSNLLSGGPLIQQGRLRALAIANAKRSASAPDLPTVAEAGLPGFKLQSWFSIVAPAGTEPAVVDRLNTALNAVLKSPEIRQKLLAQGGMEPGGGTPAELKALIAKDLATYDEIVKTAHIEMQ